MKERPILFSAPMVRAILSGDKTQTRRIVKLKDIKRNPDNDPWYKKMIWSWRVKSGSWTDMTKESLLEECPYGSVGDRLWVRETFCQVGDGTIIYKADGFRRLCNITLKDDRWRPSIHMPRLVCRVILEIVSVRVELLNSISEDNAKTEGIKELGRCSPPNYSMTDKQYSNGFSVGFKTAKDAFKNLWEKINSAESWSENPWVWVIEFKRVTP